MIWGFNSSYKNEEIQFKVVKKKESDWESD